MSDEQLTVLRSLDIVDSIDVEAKEARQLLTVQTKLGASAVPMLVQQLEGASIGRVAVREATLEDAYVRLVARAR